MSRSLTHRQITGVGCRARVGVGVPPTMRKLRACEGGLTMTTTEELLELERAAWKALSTDGETAAAFYEEVRSEEHTSELQSLMRISYAVFCLKKKSKRTLRNRPTTT